MFSTMRTTRKVERFLAGLAGPGLAAWVVAAALGVAAVIMLADPATRPYAPALLATAVVLLAIGRFWTVRRLASEVIGLGAGQTTMVLAVCTLLPRPFDLAFLPLATLCVIIGVESANAWRFAPDEGQGSDLWMFTHAFPACMGPCFGLLAVMPAVLPLVGSGQPPLVIACLVTGGTLGGRWFQLMWSYVSIKPASA